MMKEKTADNFLFFITYKYNSVALIRFLSFYIRVKEEYTIIFLYIILIRKRFRIVAR